MSDDNASDQKESESQNASSKQTIAVAGLLGTAGSGFLLVLVAIAVLFNNESRTVNRARALKVGYETVEPIDASTIDPANEGKLVLFSGNVVANGVVSDSDFGIEEKSLALKRKVEIYQWKETETQSGSGENRRTEYKYNRVWSEKLIDSSSFHRSGYDNPRTVAYTSRDFYAPAATIGAFSLSGRQISKLEPFAPYDPSVSGSATRRYRFYNNGYYIGDPQSPRVGDLRISFTFVASPCPTTFVGRQMDNSLVEYRTEYGDLLLQKGGLLSKDAIFAHANKENHKAAILRRLIGFLAMLIGFNLAFSPLANFASFFPIVPTIVKYGTKIVAFSLSIFVSLATIAVGWVYFRPGVALGVLAVAVLALAIPYAIDKNRSTPLKPKRLKR